MVTKPVEEPSSPVSPVSLRQPDLTATLRALPVCLICHTPTAAAATAADTNKGLNCGMCRNMTSLFTCYFKMNRTKVEVTGIQVRHQIHLAGVTVSSQTHQSTETGAEPLISHT